MIAINAVNPVTERSSVLGSGTGATFGVASETVSTARSAPGVSVDPREGKSKVEMVGDAVNSVPSDSKKLVWFSVASKSADENRVVSGNSTGNVGPKNPGPMFPREITFVVPSVVSVRELSRKMSGSKAGKSGGNAKPPSAGSPVRFAMLNTFTPELFPSASKIGSKERIPILMGSAIESAGINNNIAVSKPKHLFMRVLCQKLS